MKKFALLSILLVFMVAPYVYSFPPAPLFSLPTQTGNSGKALTTDGTDPSWSVTPQPVDATLTALAALTITEGSLIYGTGADAFQVLAKGTGGYNLRMNAGATAPEWVAPGTIKGTTGGLDTTFSEATATLAGASTVIQVNVPANSRIRGIQMRVDTLITSDTGTSWDATLSGGAVDLIAHEQPFAKNTKVNSLVFEVVAAETDITITPSSGTFTAGVIRAIVYYDRLLTMDDAP